MLKADVEGAELEVLAGATEVLAETELVLLELSLFELVPGTPQLHEVVALMHQHGFVDRRSPVMLECDATSVEITDLAVRTFRPGLYRPIKDLVGRAEDDGVVCMRYLKTTEAATLLNVSPNTLRAWERRFGFPKPQRSLGGHRSYAHGEVAALREALQGGNSISSAVPRARAGVAADTASLVRALVAYDRDRADCAMETALALRTVERSVDEVLLLGLEVILGRSGAESAAWAFSARWAADWLRRAMRLGSPTVSPVSIVLGDASRDELDLDAPYIRALELFCVRAGVKVLSLSARAVHGIGDVASVHRPNLVVLAGGEVDDDTVGRWAQDIGRSVGPLPLALYRRARTCVCDTVLPSAPGEAQLRLVDLADATIPRGSISWRANVRSRLPPQGISRLA